ncbi:MAG: cell division protein SepF [Candidatus Methanoplasma sp.]|jgi:SepF-like predicted cell division protein (DUF552 family)|nr:cell division protein SepF [Candidatus Methanoplasma sp.]
MFGRRKRQEKQGTQNIFVDLDGFPVASAAPSGFRVRVVETTSYRDLKPIVDMASGGNVVVLDLTGFADGDDAKRKMATYLSDLARDMGGGFAATSDKLMVISPGGWGIDRCRIARKEK